MRTTTLSTTALVAMAALFGFALQASAANTMLATRSVNKPMVQQFTEPVEPFFDEKIGNEKTGMDTDRQTAHRYGSEETVAEASEVFEKANEKASQSIPAATIQNAAAIAIFPGRISTSLSTGGAYTSGVMLVRQDDGKWSRPLFASLSSGPMGEKMGGASTDLILAINDRRTIDNMVNGWEFTLGNDTSVAEGPIGKSASASDANIYAYQRESGKFSGAKLTGSVFRIEKDPTIAYYNISQGEAGAFGYYRTDRRLYQDVVGFSSNQAIQRHPDSAARLQHAVDDYVSRMMQ
ncbi:MAG TPA: lipid-binding SYLF domain-containing protein [Desulfosarcina sp.]|nr:lipid-binding SYLF domain-containing protein [Desulfosarcina sp.]